MTKIHFPGQYNFLAFKCYLVNLQFKAFSGAHFTAQWWSSSLACVFNLLSQTVPALPFFLSRHLRTSYPSWRGHSCNAATWMPFLPRKLRLTCPLLIRGLFLFSFLHPDYELLKDSNLIETLGYRNILLTEWSFVVVFCMHTCTHMYTCMCAYTEIHRCQLVLRGSEVFLPTHPYWLELLKIWNSSWVCMSSLHKSHSHLLCITPNLVYILPKWALNLYVWVTVQSSLCKGCPLWQSCSQQSRFLARIPLWVCHLWG